MLPILQRLFFIPVCFVILMPPFDNRVRAQFGQRFVAGIFTLAVERTLGEILSQLPAALFFGAMDTIQLELNLKLEESKKLELLREEFQRDLWTALGEAGVNLVEKGVDEPGRLEHQIADWRGKLIEVLSRVNQKYDDKISGFLSPQKRQRLSQIAWQVGGSRSLLDPRVATALELSDEQKSQLQKVLKDSDDQRTRPGALGGGLRGGKRTEKWDEMRRARDAKARDVLTPGQRDKLKELYGPEMDVEALRKQAFNGLVKVLQSRPDSP